MAIKEAKLKVAGIFTNRSEGTIGTLCEDKVISSGYYRQKTAEEFCDMMNLQEDSFKNRG